MSEHVTLLLNQIKEEFKEFLIDDSDLEKNWIKYNKSGSYAEVTKGKYNGNDVALKKLTLSKQSVKDIMMDEIEKKCLYTELSILKRLKHENIPKLEAILVEDKGDKKDKVVYFILQYVDGYTLKEYFERKLYLNYNQKLMISYRLVKILKYITENGVIHRDIKPENIIIEKDSNFEPYLIDFGFSKIKSTDSSYTMTSPKYTLLYSPPENVIVEEEYSETIGISKDSFININDNKYMKITYKVDVWAFGCVIYEMFTGKRPWMYKKQGELTQREIHDFFNKKIPIYSEEDKNLYPDILEIVHNCTIQNVNNRWSVFQAYAAVEKLIEGQRKYINISNDDKSYIGEVIKVNKDDDSNTVIEYYDGFGKLVSYKNNAELRTTYIGRFEYGNKAKFGVEQGNDYEYIGYWRAHLKNGYGYLRNIEYDQENYYIGTYKNNQKNGIGCFVIKDDTTSIGQYSKDCLVEGMRYNKIENIVYKGRFKEDAFVFGEVCFLNDGLIYYGEYKENYKNGFGYLTDMSGVVISQGKWEMDELILSIV